MIKIGDSPYLECSSKGDKRFSAFYARIRSKGNYSIEELYQGYKKFDDGFGGIITNLNWRDAKGKKATNQEEASVYYSLLWDLYFQENPHLIEVIKQYNGFSDMFGQKGSCCQAITIYELKKLYD